MKLNMKPVLLCIGLSMLALQAQAQELPEAAPAPESRAYREVPNPEKAARKETDRLKAALNLTDKQYTIKNWSGNNGNYRQLFDKDDSGIIAYGEFISDESTSSYQRIEIPIEYRANRTPKYIIIVASSSRYGDYYIGGVGSKLWIDEMELVYE